MCTKGNFDLCTKPVLQGICAKWSLKTSKQKKHVQHYQSLTFSMMTELCVLYFFILMLLSIQSCPFKELYTAQFCQWRFEHVTEKECIQIFNGIYLRLEFSHTVKNKVKCKTINSKFSCACQWLCLTIVKKEKYMHQTQTILLHTIVV